MSARRFKLVYFLTYQTVRRQSSDWAIRTRNFFRERYTRVSWLSSWGRWWCWGYWGPLWPDRHHHRRLWWTVLTASHAQPCPTGHAAVLTTEAELGEPVVALLQVQILQIVSEQLQVLRGRVEVVIDGDAKGMQVHPAVGRRQIFHLSRVLWQFSECFCYWGISGLPIETFLLTTECPGYRYEDQDSQ